MQVIKTEDGIYHAPALKFNMWTTLKLKSYKDVSNKMGAFVFMLPNSTDHTGCFAGQYVNVSMLLFVCRVGTMREWKEEEEDGRKGKGIKWYIIMVTMIKVYDLELIWISCVATNFLKVLPCSPYSQVRANIEGKEHTRYFSPVSRTSNFGIIELVMRFENQGIMSQHFKNLKPGKVCQHIIVYH